jgi:multiple sugar transport system ATP-binding protein
MVFQSYALYPHLTVARNMAQPLRLAGRPRAEIDARVRAAAEILSLTPLLDRLPRQLSGGQRQRVAMGRAIVRDPQVFLFDEPLSNLDAKLRVQMRSEIKELHQRLRTSTIYVTHDQVEAMTMADRIVVMNGGRVVQIGDPLSLYDQPETVFVAGFLGSPAMNLLEGRIEPDDDGWRFALGDGAGLRLARRPDGVSPGRPVVLGIRPEHLVVTPGAVAAAEARVVVVEPTGADTLAVVRIGAASLGVLFRDRMTLRLGAVVPVGLPAERLHAFDPETGARLDAKF